jgi:hypothetical protein
MSLQPYEYYAGIGTANANKKWESKLPWFLGGFAVVGALIGQLVGKQLVFLAGGALIGALIGYGVFRLVVYLRAASTADDLYRADWCTARGMTYWDDFVYPPDAPYATSGDKRRATDAYEGTWNGLPTLFYNFTYTDVDPDPDDPDRDYDFRIMRLTGRELPIQRLSIQRRSAINRFEWADKLQGAMTRERPVSLESAAFNETFDLTIDDQADDVWIRRVFDPATIQGVLDGSIPMADIRYYNWAWWIVERGHFKTRDLEQWVGVQKTAADAIAVLSRVQGL